MTDAFISYSHTDREFALQVQRALTAAGKIIWIDESDIPSGAKFAEYLQRAIEDAACFLYLVSPSSVKSAECANELRHAVELNKRLIPIAVKLMPLDALPPAIQSIQFVPSRGLFDEMSTTGTGNRFDASLRLLITAIDTDLDALHEHTEWETKALEWDRSGRDRSFLISGSELVASENWLLRTTPDGPQPTDLQRTFVVASRQGATRRQRRLLAGVTVALVIAVILAGLALIQRSHAVAAERTALSGELSSESVNFATKDAQLESALALQASAFDLTMESRSALAQAYAQPLRMVLTTGAPSNSVAYSPDGSRLATGDQDGRIETWSTKAGTKLVGDMVDQGGGGVTALAYSPNEPLLVSGDYRGRVMLWNTTTHARIGEVFNRTKSQISQIAFNSAGTIFAAISQGGSASWWFSNTQQAIGTFTEPGTGLDSMAISPDGGTLAVGDNFGAITLIDLQTGHVSGATLSVSPGNAVSALAFRPDGKRLASGAADGTLKFWDMTTDEMVGQAVVTRAGTNAIAYTPDGRSVAVSSQTGAVIVLTVAGENEVGPPFPAGNDILSMAMNPAGTELATSDGVGHTDIWQLAPRPKFGMELKGSGSYLSLAYSHDGKMLATGDYDGNVAIWNSVTGSRIGLPSTLESGNAIRTIAFSEDDKLLVAGDDDGNIVFYQTTDGPRDGLVTLDDNQKPDGTLAPVDDIAISHDGSLLAAAGTESPDIDLVNMRTKTSSGELSICSCAAGVASIAFTPDGKTLAVGDTTGRVALWDLRTGRPIRQFSSPGASTIQSLAVSPDGKLLAAGDLSGTVTLWGLEPKDGSGQSLPSDDDDAIRSLAFSADGRMLAAGSRRGFVQLWNLDSRSEIVKLPLVPQYDVFNVAFSPDGRSLAAAADTAGAFVVPSTYWSGPLKTVDAALCSEIRTNLTRTEWSQFVPNQPYHEACPSYPS